MLSRNALTSAMLFILAGPALMTTNCHRDALIDGWFSSMSLSWSLGSCNSAPKLAGAMTLAQCIKPFHSCGFVQIFLVMSREKRVVEMKPASDL